MPEVLRLAVSVTTPLALLGLVVAIGFFAYTRRLKFAEKRLELLPVDKRANAADEYLTRYSIDGKKLPLTDKLVLIRDEMEKRHRRSMAVLTAASVVFVICFALSVAAFAFHSPGSHVAPLTVLKKTFKLSVDIQGMQILTPTSTIASSDFEGHDAANVIDQAAAWVKSTLDTRFRLADKELHVEPLVSFDKGSKSYKFQLEEDPLRQDLFWVFTEDGVKTSHLSLENSRRALEESIAKASTQKEDHQLVRIVLHSDRPGYDLELIRVPIGVKAEAKTLKWLGKPLKLSVDLGRDDTGVEEQLRNRLQGLGFAIERENVKQKDEIYKQAFTPRLSDETRLSFLRQLRVNAHVKGTFTQLAEPGD